MRAGIPGLRALIMNTDEEVLQDTCWGLAYVVEGSEDNIQVLHRVCTSAYVWVPRGGRVAVLRASLTLVCPAMYARRSLTPSACRGLCSFCCTLHPGYDHASLAAALLC